MFAPAGHTARWRILYGLLTELDPGETLTYEAMAEALDLDPHRDRAKIRSAITRAAAEHEVEDKRALQVVPNVGYRVADAGEHIRLARDHQRKSSRSLERGHSKVVNLDRTRLDPATRKLAELIGLAFQAQQDFNRRFDVRQQNLEQAVEMITKRGDRTEDELLEMRQRMDRLEGRLLDSAPVGAADPADGAAVLDERDQPLLSEGADEQAVFHDGRLTLGQAQLLDLLDRRDGDHGHNRAP